MKTVRCSALPRIMSCPASAQDPSVRINAESAAATTGTAAHEIYAAMVMGRADTVAPGLDGEMSYLAWAGLDMWRKMRDRINVLDCEISLSAQISDDVTLTGHPDVIGRLSGDSETGVVIDWKTGYVERDCSDQMRGYALLMTHYPKWLLVAAHTRLGTTTTYEATSEELVAFRGRIIDAVTNPKKVYNPTPCNCEYCPMSHECPARVELLGSSCRELQAMTGTTGDITPAALASLYGKSRMLLKAIDAYESQLKEALKAGPIETDEGTIELVDAARETITYDREALKAAGMTDDEINQLQPTISKKGLGKRAKDIVESLRKDGLVQTTSYKKMQMKKGKTA